MSETLVKPRPATCELPEGGRGRARNAEFQDVDPFRPLAWRWERALCLVKEDRPLSPRRGDPPTVRAARYLKAFNRCQTDRERVAVTRRFADIATARGIYEEGDVIRWLIEARFLARQSVAEIAKHASLTVPAVEAYESLFFNVADVLDATGYIMFHTMRRFVGVELRETDGDVVLKLIAYHGGPAALDAAIPFLLAPGLELVQPSEGRRVLGEKVKRFVRVLTRPRTTAKFREDLADWLAVVKHKLDSEGESVDVKRDMPPLPSFEGAFADAKKVLAKWFGDDSRDSSEGVA